MAGSMVSARQANARGDQGRDRQDNHEVSTSRHVGQLLQQTAPPIPAHPLAVCPVCLERGHVETVEVNGRSYQRVVGCRCDKEPTEPRK